MKPFVAALGAELSLTSEEIADIIWLAVQMGELPQPATSDSSGSLDTGKSPTPQQIDPPIPKDPIDLPNPESSPPPAELYVPEGSNLGGGLAISVPDARSLREPLELARSLKPLLQWVARGWSNDLDEEATIDRIVNDRLWLPVLKPNLEAWLDLVLVVDESVSMQIWQRTISESIVRTPFEKKNGQGGQKNDSSLKVQVETQYQMNRCMDIVQNLLAKVGNLANRNASS